MEKETTSEEMDIRYDPLMITFADAGHCGMKCEALVERGVKWPVECLLTNEFLDADNGYWKRCQECKSPSRGSFHRSELVALIESLYSSEIIEERRDAKARLDEMLALPEEAKEGAA